MAKTVTIPLKEPIVGHAGSITKIVLREPTFDELLELGEPTIWTRAPDGAIFPIENGETIRKYITACLIEPKDPLLIEQGGFKLARALKAAVLDFFRDDDGATAPLSTSPTTSSSNAAKDGSAPTSSAA